VGGVLATLQGKTVGALLLAAAGCGLLVLTLSLTASGTSDSDHQIALFHAAFWLPASICNIGAGLALARSHVRGPNRV
jgi:hypothetical protein